MSCNSFPDKNFLIILLFQYCKKGFGNNINNIQIKEITKKEICKFYQNCAVENKGESTDVKLIKTETMDTGSL